MAKTIFTDASDWGCDLQGRDLPLSYSGTSARSVTRRGFLRGGALVGTSVIPAFLTRSVYAEVARAAAGKKKLVVIFQRGACDGLNVVVPYKEPNYYAMRPTIWDSAEGLDGFGWVLWAASGDGFGEAAV